LSTTTPSATRNAPGNLLAQGTTLNANTTAAALTVDATAHLEVCLQFKQVFPNAAPTTPSGLQVSIGRVCSSSNEVDTQYFTQYVLISVQNATQFGSINLPGGYKYTLSVKNLDTTSNITYGITGDFVDVVTA
jgi:hypothetical protein